MSLLELICLHHVNRIKLLPLTSYELKFSSRFEWTSACAWLHFTVVFRLSQSLLFHPILSLTSFPFAHLFSHSDKYMLLHECVVHMNMLLHECSYNYINIQTVGIKFSIFLSRIFGLFNLYLYSYHHHVTLTVSLQYNFLWINLIFNL